MKCGIWQVLPLVFVSDLIYTFVGGDMLMLMT